AGQGLMAIPPFSLRVYRNSVVRLRACHYAFLASYHKGRPDGGGTPAPGGASFDLRNAEISFGYTDSRQPFAGDGMQENSRGAIIAYVDFTFMYKAQSLLSASE